MVQEVLNSTTQQQEELSLLSPENDSGLCVDASVSIIDTDEDADSDTCTDKSSKKKSYRKPDRPCLFCHKFQAQLKRHILQKHKDLTEVKPLLNMKKKDQDRFIAIFRKNAIKTLNINE